MKLSEKSIEDIVVGFALCFCVGCCTSLAWKSIDAKNSKHNTSTPSTEVVDSLAVK